MKDKKFIYGSIIAVVFLLTVGLTYAYFSLTVSGNDVAQTINVSTTKIGLIYTDGNEVKANGIEPKWTTTKTITVENTGNEEAYYALGWQKLYNEVQKDELVIRSTCTSTGVTGGTCDNTDNVVIPQTNEVTAETNKILYPYKENILILPGETHTYTVTIEFINYEDKAQNYNQGKKFYGTLGAAESSKKVILTNYLIENYSTLGLTKIDQTATGNQTYATTEYRYQGKTPNNYITFNGETGVWRIIGVFEAETPKGDGTYTKETKVKIMRNSSIGTAAWNSTKTATNYNDWTTATLMTTLNSGDYYNRTGEYASNGLTDTAKSQISSTKWYLGNGSGSSNTQTMYSTERSSSVHSGNSQTWDGEVALIYGSDYMYASNKCYNTDTNAFMIYECGDIWMTKELPNWTLTPSSSLDSAILCVILWGNLSEDSWNDNEKSHGYTYRSGNVRPSLYLSSTISYISGDGSTDNPFIIE